MIGKLKKINEDLIEFFSNTIETMLGIVGFLLAFPVMFVAIFASIGSFFMQKNYLWGLIHLVIAVVAFYASSGIGRYLKK